MRLPVRYMAAKPLALRSIANNKQAVQRVLVGSLGEPLTSAQYACYLDYSHESVSGHDRGDTNALIRS